MKFYEYILIILIFSSCANIVPPTGGLKDTSPPVLLSNLNILNNESKLEKVILTFDENIQMHHWQNFYISPPLDNIDYKIRGKQIIINFNSNLSSEYIYWLSLSKCIKDLTEGNIISNLEFNLKENKNKISENIKVSVKNSFTNQFEENHWVLLYPFMTSDSSVFNSKPLYLSKTKLNGIAEFNNINGGSYKLVSISGDDYFYHEDELISFSDSLIEAGKDTLINLYCFNPLQITDTLESYTDTTSQTRGSLMLNTNISGNIIVQLINGNKVVLEEYFYNTNLLKLKNISTGVYDIRLFFDRNNNLFWDSGSFTERYQPEKMYYYPEKITIRENWDLELEWIIEE